jgi:hypothetical protein
MHFEECALECFGGNVFWRMSFRKRLLGSASWECVLGMPFGERLLRTSFGECLENVFWRMPFGECQRLSEQKANTAS